jgi:hypothetical protein
MGAMAVDQPKRRASAATRRNRLAEADVRKQYRAHRVRLKYTNARLRPDRPTTQFSVPNAGQRGLGDRRWFNPILIDPADPAAVPHPANFRNIAHATAVGYFFAGCGCYPCSDAGALSNERNMDEHIEVRLNAHRAQVRALLSERAPHLGEDVLDAAADGVVAVHRVHVRRYAILHYDQAAVHAVLRAWNIRQVAGLPEDVLGDLAATIAESLTRSSETTTPHGRPVARKRAT